MSLKKWTYSFNLRTKNMRNSLGLSNVCYHCGKMIELGEDVYSRNASSSKSKSKLYHKRCAEVVNIL